VEVDNIDPLDIRKTPPLLDPLVLPKPTEMPFQQSFNEPSMFHSMASRAPYPLQWILMIPLILLVEYNLQVCPATSAIYSDFMLLTSFLWKFILVCKSLDYKLLNDSAPRSSQEFSPISRSSSNLSDPDYALHGPSARCINFAAANGVDSQSAVFQAPIPTDNFTRALLFLSTSCLYILTVLYLVACTDRTLDARAASSSHAPEYALFGFNSLSSSNGSALHSPYIVHHNKPLALALLFRVVVGLPAITMRDLLTWYEYVGG
jgi:hypothetical protein